MFGVINALFSGLGLAGLIYTLLLQRESLNTQQIELEKQEQELANQNREVKRQRFESSFIQLLQVHNNLARDLIIHDKENDRFIRGVDCFTHLLNQLYMINPEVFDSTSGIYPKDQSAFNKGYEQLLKRFDNDFSHYLRSIYHLIKFPQQESINEDDKKTYCKMVRARLTSDELRIIFYNCIYWVFRKHSATHSGNIRPPAMFHLKVDRSKLS